jgi:hypothetical protein
MKYLLYIRLRLKIINLLKTHNENMKKTLATTTTTTTTTTKKQQQVEQNVFYYFFFSLFVCKHHKQKAY